VPGNQRREVALAAVGLMFPLAGEVDGHHAGQYKK
jgi:hypothetical protein